MLKHALRNAAMPVVAIAAVQLGFMLGGSIVIESVFNLPGVGYLAWESISKNDFPVVQAVVLLLALIYIGLTLAADLLNAVLDPRLRDRPDASSSPRDRCSARCIVGGTAAGRAVRPVAGRTHDPFAQDLDAPADPAGLARRRRRRTRSAPTSSAATTWPGWSTARASRC